MSAEDTSIECPRTISCSCPKTECENHTICCDCVENHKNSETNKLPYCLR